MFEVVDSLTGVAVEHAATMPAACRVAEWRQQVTLRPHHVRKENRP